MKKLILAALLWPLASYGFEAGEVVSFGSPFIACDSPEYFVYSQKVYERTNNIEDSMAVFDNDDCVEGKAGSRIRLLQKVGFFYEFGMRYEIWQFLYMGKKWYTAAVDPRERGA